MKAAAVTETSTIKY